MQTQLIPSGFAPDSYYAECSAEERAVFDRQEAAYNHQRHLEALDRFGPHTSHWLRFKTDDELRRATKRLTREVEDIESGDLPDDAKGRRLRLTRARLADHQHEAEFRQTLRETWQASERGTHSITGYEARGGLLAVIEHGATPPSYPLAVLLDYRNFKLGEPSVFDWTER